MDTIYISSDMEGVAGVVDWPETESGHPDYDRFRRIMTDEVNAAVEGAVQGGATGVVVNDSHDSMKNILIEHLHPKASLLSGNPKRSSMMEGIDSTFSGVFLTGYHAPAGTTSSILDHTYSSTTHRVFVNGIEAPEMLLFGAVAGECGVPIKLVTGDETTCALAKEYFGDIATVAVKKSVSRRAALSKPLQTVMQEIKEAAKDAITSPGKVFRFESPYTLNVEFQHTRQADEASVVPLAERIDGYTLQYVHTNYNVIIDAFRAMVHLSYR